jgi:hypothetical protein
MAERGSGRQCGSSWNLPDKCHSGDRNVPVLKMGSLGGKGHFLSDSQCLLRNPNKKCAESYSLCMTLEAERRPTLGNAANNDAASSVFGFRNKNQLAPIIYKFMT